MSPDQTSMANRVIFFDGVCPLCHASVRFVIKNDPEAYFSFASLQSDFAQHHLKRKGLDGSRFNTLFLLEDDNVFTESTAVFKIASKLKFPWKLLGIFLHLSPRLRDFPYRWIAQSRYKWWGRLESCPIPSSEEEHRFYK